MEGQEQQKLLEENAYLKTMLSVHERRNERGKPKNIGEKDEVLVQIDLYYLNQQKQYDRLVEIFGDGASQGIMFLDINTGEEILDMNQFSKAPTNLKADCIIQMKKTGMIYHPSIKSKNAAPPAILNHTPRSANVFQENGALYKYLNSLDTLVAEYIDKRTRSLIKEDKSVRDLEWLTDPSIKSDFMNVLLYFMFEGTGERESSLKADSILYYKYNNNDSIIVFIPCISHEEKMNYLETIFDKMIISLRDKDGMPDNQQKLEYCQNWIYLDGEKKKGKLHVRVDEKQL